MTSNKIADEISADAVPLVLDRLQGLVTDLRLQTEHAEDPRFQALCETTAEVLLGLVKAFDDFQRKQEAAWTDQPASKA